MNIEISKYKQAGDEGNCFGTGQCSDCFSNQTH